MYVPITSEIIIKTGMVLREISTEQLFEVTGRQKSSTEVSGQDIWRITPITPADPDLRPVVLPRQELSEKYFAEVAD